MEAKYRDTGLPLEGSIDDRSATLALRDAIAALSKASARVLRAVSRCADEGTFRERGFRSMTEWLSTEFPIGRRTAREWVTLSKALRDLPWLAEAYEGGRLTWEQVRPVARFADAESDAHWSEAARRMYPAQLWREHARRTRLGIKDENEIHASRYLSLVWDKERPLLYVEGRLGKEQGSALEEALRRRAERIARDPAAADPVEARNADALVEIATSGGGDAAPQETLVVHTSGEVLARSAPRSGPWLAETASGKRLHGETIRRLACDARVDWLPVEEGRPLGIGRQGKVVPGWLERVVRHRDGGMCRFPGCERTTFLKSHHIKHWADGGPTDLDNLVTLCGTHHRLIHEGGWRIAGDPAGELRFHDRNGRPLERASPVAAA